MKLKWHNGVYRRQLTDMHINDTSDEYLSSFNAQTYLNNLKKAHIQSPIIPLQTKTGLCYYPTEVAKTHNMMTGPSNEIRRLISLCKDNGMKVVGYYSLVFNNIAADKHPEWEMINEDGATLRECGHRYGLCCPNNFDYRSFLDENIRELADFYPDLDGVVFAIPKWDIDCHCPSCQQRYLEETGMLLPNKESHSTQDWLTYIKRRQEWTIEFAYFARQVILNYLPEITVEFDLSSLFEGFTEGINDASEFASGSLSSKLYLESFANKYFYSISNSQPFEHILYSSNSGLKKYLDIKSQAKLNSEILLTCAHHGATLCVDSINPDGTMDERVYEKVGNAFAKQLPYEKYMDKGELYADVAVYYDSNTLFKEAQLKTNNKECSINAHKALIENHIPVAVVANTKLTNLQKYKMVVASCLQDFDNDEPLKLIDYVKNGGTLYLSGKSDSRLIKEFFGGDFYEYVNENSPYEHVDKGYEEVQSYIYPIEDYESIFEGYSYKYPLPVTYKLPTYINMSGEVKAYINLPYTDPDNNKEYASIDSNPPGKPTNIPAIMETMYGDGRVIWTSALIENESPEIFINIVKKFVSPKYVVTTNKYVESVIFEDTDKVYISLVDINEYYEKDERKVTIKLPFTPKEIRNIGSARVIPGASIISGSFNEFLMLEITK